MNISASFIKNTHIINNKNHLAMFVVPNRALTHTPHPVPVFTRKPACSRPSARCRHPELHDSSTTEVPSFHGLIIHGAFRNLYLNITLPKNTHHLLRSWAQKAKGVRVINAIWLLANWSHVVTFTYDHFKTAEILLGTEDTKYWPF